MRLLLLLLFLPSLATASQVFKCVQPDGSIAFQQTDCPTSAAQEKVDVTPVPPPTPERRMTQVYDPATGISREAWADVTPAPPSGATYTTREMRQVFDPMTGRPSEAWVDVVRPVPNAAGARYRRQADRDTWTLPPRADGPHVHNYYKPSDQERIRNSQYERARCKVVSC